MLHCFILIHLHLYLVIIDVVELDGMHFVVCLVAVSLLLTCCCILLSLLHELLAFFMYLLACSCINMLWPVVAVILLRIAFICLYLCSLFIGLAVAKLICL